MTETIGQRLKRAREYNHLTLEKAAGATRIRLQYLQALEADDFSAMPSPVQARGFLRNYADYLGLDLEQMVSELRQAAPKPAPSQEVVFEGDLSQPEPPGALTQASQAPVSQQPPPPAVKEKNSLVSWWREWRQRITEKRESPLEPSGETTSPGEEPHADQPVAVEESQPPVSRRSGRKKASPKLGEEAPAPAQAEGEPVETLPEPDVLGGQTVEEVTPVSVWTVITGWVRRRIVRRAPSPDAEPGTQTPEEEQAAPQAVPSPVGAEQPVESVQDIYHAIGSQLRQRREILSLSYEEIERHTRMRAQFLAALEEGRMDDLPSPVQTRGMLSNYATFLDLDADTLLLRFADALQAQHRERHPDKTAGRRSPPAVPEKLPILRVFIAGDLVFGISMGLLLFVVVVWGISRVLAIRSQQVDVEATAPSISEALIGTPQATLEEEAVLIPVEDTPLPALVEGTAESPTQATPAGNFNVQVNIVSLERSYLRVTVDGEVAFDGRTVPGTAYPFEAEQSIEIVAGNASALRVIYNQRDLGLLGGFGQMVRYVYTMDEILVPTPASSPTVTLTPFLTPTPSITPSPTPASPPGGG